MNRLCTIEGETLMSRPHHRRAARSGAGGTAGDLSDGASGHGAGYHRYLADDPGRQVRQHLHQRLPGPVCAEEDCGRP